MLDGGSARRALSAAAARQRRRFAGWRKRSFYHVTAAAATLSADGAARPHAECTGAPARPPNSARAARMGRGARARALAKAAAAAVAVAVAPASAAAALRAHGGGGGGASGVQLVGSTAHCSAQDETALALRLALDRAVCDAALGIVAFPNSSSASGRGDERRGSCCVRVSQRVGEDRGDVWQYDVPPTPFTAAEQTVACVSDAPHAHRRAGDALRGAADSNDAAGDVVTVPAVRAGRGLYQYFTALLCDESGVPLGAPMAHFAYTTGAPTRASERALRAAIQNKAAIAARREALEEADARDASDDGAAYRLRNAWLADAPLERLVQPSLLAAARARDGHALRALLRTLRDGPAPAYAFDVLLPEASSAITEEVDAALASGMRLRRPNSMNNYGLLLQEIGLAEVMQRLLAEVFSPMALVAFPDWGGASLDHTHAFTVRYAVGEDRLLDRHMDASDVTLNVCLGEAGFEGAELYLDSVRDEPDSGEPGAVASDARVNVTHTIGTGIMHVGQLWHGVHPLKAGVRQNLVAWLKSSRQRGSAAEAYAEMCHGIEGRGAVDIVTVGWRGEGARVNPRESEQELRRRARTSA